MSDIDPSWFILSTQPSVMIDTSSSIASVKVKGCAKRGRYSIGVGDGLNMEVSSTVCVHQQECTSSKSIYSGMLSPRHKSRPASKVYPSSRSIIW